jgi:cytochrome c-type biogenesis protein
VPRLRVGMPPTLDPNPRPSSYRILTARTLPAVPRHRPVPAGRGSRGSSGADGHTFGAAYALASLGCTIGPFLVTVVATFRTGSVIEGAAVFAAYAAGMGVVVAAVSVAVALARTSVVGVLRRSGRVVSRLGGLLAVAGGYVAYNGWYEIRLQRGAETDDPVIETAGAVQRWLANGVDRIGIIGAALVLAALLTVAAMRKLRRRT